jgi:hypothetical protein
MRTGKIDIVIDEWPEPPSGASFDEVKRHANIRFLAEYLLGVDTALPVGDESELAREQAWKSAEEHFDDPAHSRIEEFMRTGVAQ